MAKITELIIKKMFSAYANRHGQDQMQYYCESCSQQFSAYWNIRANPYNSWFSRGNSVLCPYCGKRHDKHIGTMSKGEHVPYEVKLTLYTYISKVVLSVKYKAFCFNDLYELEGSTGEEVFTFNIEDEKSSFARSIKIGKNDVEISTLPIDCNFKDEILSSSVLQYFYNRSLANTKNRDKLVDMMRKLRNEIAVKLANKHQCKISSLYINALGSEHGMFLLPIINLANRIKSSTSQNIDANYRVSKRILVPTVPKWAEIRSDWMNRYKERIQEGKDKITAMIEAIGLPNKDAVRKLVGADSQNINFLKVAFDLCSNYDLAIRFSQAFKNLKDISKPDTIRFLKEMLKVYSEQDIVQFLDKAIEYNLKDCLQLHEKLTEENKIKLLENRIRLRELHDWMAIEHKKQTHKNIDLKVPTHIINRLAMQKDKLSFFLPKESEELLRVGHSLNNCVASYSERMAQGKQWIVVGTDSKGKYTACLRVCNNELVEAKINRNKSVANDSVINKAVIEWAKEANLVIKTSDVMQEITESKQLKVS